MKSITTGVIAVAVCMACFFVGVKDGENVDFYWKPLLAIWYAVTLAAFLAPRSRQMLTSIKKAWWLQIAVPVVLFSLSLILVRIYEPHPLLAVPHP